MKRKPTKDEIIAWMQHLDFNKGIELYSRIKKSSHPKDLKALVAKLCYIYKIEKPQSLHKAKPKAQPQPQPQSQSQPQHQHPVKNTEIKTEHKTPHFIEKIVKEHARLVMLRSQLDEQRKELGMLNTEPIMKKRRAITQSIHEHSEKIERLYNAKEDYYNKAVMPDMVALGLEDDSEKKVSPAEQQKKINALRNAQRKDQNLLDFQSNTTQQNPNPMPDGPKRRSIIKRMEKRLKEIETLTKQ